MADLLYLAQTFVTGRRDAGTRTCDRDRIELICSAPARADPPKVAVFDFEMFETRLQGEYLRDAHGNTDESWSRAASSLLRNRLLAPDDGAPQPQ